MPLSGTPRPRGEGRQAEGRVDDPMSGRTAGRGQGGRSSGWQDGGRRAWSQDGGRGRRLGSGVQCSLGSRVVVGCAGRGRRTEDVVVDAGRCSQGPGWSGAGIPVRRHACTQAYQYAGIRVCVCTCMRVYVLAVWTSSCLDVWLSGRLAVWTSRAQPRAPPRAQHQRTGQKKVSLFLPKGLTGAGKGL